MTILAQYRITQQFHRTYRGAIRNRAHNRVCWSHPNHVTRINYLCYKFKHIKFFFTSFKIKKNKGNEPSARKRGRPAGSTNKAIAAKKRRETEDCANNLKKIYFLWKILVELSFISHIMTASILIDELMICDLNKISFDDVPYDMCADYFTISCWGKVANCFR